jgi:hypothetical protein
VKWLKFKSRTAGGELVGANWFEIGGQDQSIFPEIEDQ